MRLSLFAPVLALLAPPLATAPATWEKTLAEGVVYRSEADPATKRALHAVRFDPRAPGLRLMPELAGGTVFEPAADTLDGRETASAAAERLGTPLAVLNADFFPYGKAPSGDPLGIMVRDGALLSLPERNRAIFAWGKGGAAAIRPTFSGTVSVAGRDPVPLTGLNDKTRLNGLSVSFPAAGWAWATAPAVFLVIDPTGDGVPAPTGRLRGRVERVVTEGDRLRVPPGRVVVSAQGERATELGATPVDSVVDLRWSLDGFDAAKYEHAIGGGPFLLRGGEIAVDASDEGFPPSFSDTKHPRSAIGLTAKGEIWLVVIDGRTENAGGMSLPELAAAMKDLGCVEAINLDGGGSSALAVKGLVVNRPSDGKERAVANFVALYGPTERYPKLRRRSELRLRPAGPDLVQADVLRDGRVYPPAEVLFSAPTGGWAVDGGGLLRRVKPGAGLLRARVGGEVLTATIPE